MATWQIQDAKAHFSELLEHAATEGPQTITRHGRSRAVVLSIKDYQKLTNLKPDLTAHLLGGPKVKNFHIKRDRGVGRKIDL